MRLTQTSRDGQLSEEENEIRHFIQYNNPEKEQPSLWKQFAYIPPSPALYS